MILSTAALSEVGLRPLPASSPLCRQGCFYAKAHIMRSNRYRWVNRADLVESVELIDTVTSYQVAVITAVGRKFSWKRNTSVLLHGAPPAEGTCDSLQQAKIKVLDGLPSEG